MTVFNRQLAGGVALPMACHSGAAVSDSASNFTRYLSRRVQAALLQHPQAYVQHVEVMFNDNAGSHLLLNVEYLRRFRQSLNTRVGHDLAAKGLGIRAGLWCEWFSTNGHHERPSLNALIFLGQRVFYLLGDERESSQTMLNRHIAAAWAGMQECFAELGNHLPNSKPRGGFYLSDRVGDSGVAALIEAMCNVAKCRCISAASMQQHEFSAHC